MKICQDNSKAICFKKLIDIKDGFSYNLRQRKSENMHKIHTEH